MEAVECTYRAVQAAEDALWHTVRLALDRGEKAGDLSAVLSVSESTLYRQLRERGLTYGRGSLGSGS